MARSLNEAGAKLVFTYADDRAKKSITELVPSLSEVNQNPLILACDVTSKEAITETFETIKDKTGKLSGLA
ncbi:SDR family oxidoreductase, partial [Salmonella enterica]|uniref:SDR family oxidoreductase n=1 Tax=Salmonella enterica TaxID=28901 RepID=UPI003D80AED0